MIGLSIFITILVYKAKATNQFTPIVNTLSRNTLKFTLTIPIILTFYLNYISQVPIILRDIPKIFADIFYIILKIFARFYGITLFYQFNYIRQVSIVFYIIIVLYINVACSVIDLIKSYTPVITAYKIFGAIEVIITSTIIISTTSR